MKPSSTSNVNVSFVFAMLMVVASKSNPLTLTAWAHSDERDLRINTASKSSDASVLRGVTANQDERTLAKGGNGGGNKSTPSPTAAVTPAPTPTPPPVFQYPPVPYDSCGTRAPSTSAPSPAPSPAPQCLNPPDGECNGGNQCCDGYSCKGRTCRLNVRRLGEHKVAFDETATEERKLGDCVDHRCNEHDNAVLCGSDIPSNRPASIICNYGGGEYTASVRTCKDDAALCCEDGNGGYYYGLSCWIMEQGATCCRKGYTRISSGCVPMNCCDGDADHQARYCPGKC